MIDKRFILRFAGTGSLLACLCCLCPVLSQAQQLPASSQVPRFESALPASSALPDEPYPQTSAQPQTSSVLEQRAPSAASDEGLQTKRILGVIPNFRSVSVNSHEPPQTAKEKLAGVAEDSFDYSSFIFVGMLSGVSQLQTSTPEFHQGAAGYQRYFWHNFADQTDENLWVGFLLPVGTP